MTERASTPVARPSLWRNVRFLRVLWQAGFVLALLLVANELFRNLQFSVERRHVDLSFDFLRFQSGIPIAEGIEYNARQSNLKAYIVGLSNTVRVAGVGIVLAMLLGLVMGVARLSSNWLVRKIAQVYVEIVRNTPVLVQIIFWYTAVILALPLVEAGSIAGVAFISNRGAAIPWPRGQDGAGVWGLVLLGGLIGGLLIARWRTRFNERTGKPHRRALWSLGFFLLVAAAGYLVIGAPVRIDAPERVGRAFEGGVHFSGEYAALLLGLVIYTAAFIAEIVRGSLLAVAKGQKEAGQALGLTSFQQLRLVVLPQALRIAIPPINSQFLNLTKNSSLGIAVAYPEIVSISGSIINKVGRPTQLLLLMMGTYLTLSLFVSVLMNLLNRTVALKGERR